VTAYDGVGLEATSFGTFEVVDTVGPTLGPISASPDPAEVGATVWVEVAAYDPSGVSSMFAEIRDAGGIVASSGLMTLVDPGVFIYSFAPRAVGTFAVSVAANDAWGNPASTDGTIAALDTTPPTADAGDDVSALAGSSVLFDGARSSDNDRVATYVWTFVESEVTVVLTGATPIHTFIKAGEYVVTLTIADPSGNEGRDHILVSVVAAKGEVIGRVTTLDGGVIPNAFVFVKDGEYVVASAQADANGSFRLPKIPPGDYTLRAEAIGFSGGEETVQVVAGEIVVATIRLAPLESPAVHVWAAVLAVSVLGLAAIGAYLQRTRRHARRPPRA
jgi:hypothetical protein